MPQEYKHILFGLSDQKGCHYEGEPVSNSIFWMSNKVLLTNKWKTYSEVWTKLWLIRSTRAAVTLRWQSRVRWVGRKSQTITRARKIIYLKEYLRTLCANGTRLITNLRHDGVATNCHRRDRRNWGNDNFDKHFDSEGKIAIIEIGLLK